MLQTCTPNGNNDTEYNTDRKGFLRSLLDPSVIFHPIILCDKRGIRIAEILYRKICKCVNFDRCRKCRHRCCPETVYKPLHHQNSKIHDRLLHLLHDFLWHT